MVPGVWEQRVNNWGDESVKAHEQVLQPENKERDRLKVWAMTRHSGQQTSGATQQAGRMNSVSHSGSPLRIITSAAGAKLCVH